MQNFAHFFVLCTSEIEQAENSATFHAAEDILHTAEEENAYIIFTSGSTGYNKVEDYRSWYIGTDI